MKFIRISELFRRSFVNSSFCDFHPLRKKDLNKPPANLFVYSTLSDYKIVK
jgi:hypothetical protein